MMSASRLGAAKTVAMEMIITELVNDSDENTPSNTAREDHQRGKNMKIKQ